MNSENDLNETLISADFDSALTTIGDEQTPDLVIDQEQDQERAIEKPNENEAVTAEATSQNAESTEAKTTKRTKSEWGKILAQKNKEARERRQRLGTTSTSTLRRSKSQKAGLLFPVQRFITSFRKSHPHHRITETAGVYLTAVIEYMCSELLDLSGEKARREKRKRIIPQDLQLAINDDAELLKLLADVVIAQGGVTPHIEPVLMEKPKKRAYKKKQPKPPAAELTDEDAEVEEGEGEEAQVAAAAAAVSTVDEETRPKKRGRKRKAENRRDEEEDEEVEEEVEKSTKRARAVLSQEDLRKVKNYLKMICEEPKESIVLGKIKNFKKNLNFLKLNYLILFLYNIRFR